MCHRGSPPYRRTFWPRVGRSGNPLIAATPQRTQEATSRLRNVRARPFDELQIPVLIRYLHVHPLKHSIGSADLGKDVVHDLRCQNDLAVRYRPWVPVSNRTVETF